MHAHLLGWSDDQKKQFLHNPVGIDLTILNHMSHSFVNGIFDDLVNRTIPSNDLSQAIFQATVKELFAVGESYDTGHKPQFYVEIAMWQQTESLEDI